MSFCPIDSPGVFETMEECLNTCKRPLDPTTVPQVPPTTTSEPVTTMPSSSPPPPRSSSSTESPRTVNVSTHTDSSSPSPTSEVMSDKEVLTTTSREEEREVTTTIGTLVTTKDENKVLHVMTTGHRLEEDGTTTDEVDSDGSGPQGGLTTLLSLNKFDLASLALGVVAIVLIFVLVGVVMFSLYRRHARLRRQKQEVM